MSTETFYDGTNGNYRKSVSRMLLTQAVAIPQIIILRFFSMPQGCKCPYKKKIRLLRSRETVERLNTRFPLVRPLAQQFELSGPQARTSNTIFYLVNNNYNIKKKSIAILHVGINHFINSSKQLK